LQNDLDKIENMFLNRGTYTDALDMDIEWHFIPLVKNGDLVVAASWLGEVKEKNISHKIMLPFLSSSMAIVSVNL
ncbi:hypothetical protein, partial [Streptomyces sp. P17]|uniref:hypothetical protein n=1 Tax=Streptomyces sp. P17 TaxID=3074716 RepID=UPI0028F3E751